MKQEGAMVQLKKRPLTERARSGCSALRILTEKDIREFTGDRKACVLLARVATPRERKVSEPATAAQKPSLEQQSTKPVRTGK